MLTTTSTGDRLLGQTPARSAGCEQLVTEIATRLEGRTDAIAAQLVDRIAAELAIVREDEDLRDDLRAVARACTSLLTAMTRTWSDPHAVPAPRDALEWARTIVARRIPLDFLLRVFRIGHSGYGEIWHRELAGSDAPPALVLEALLATSTFAFTWVDAVLETVTTVYEEERERRTRGMEALRTETVAAILAGEPVDAASAVARLAYDLDRRHLALVAWVEADATEEARDGVERVAAEAARFLGAADGRTALVLRDGPRVVHGWVPEGSCDRARAAGVAARLASTGVRVAIGRPSIGVEGFRSSHLQARRARRVARLLRRRAGLTRYDDVAVVDLLTRDAAVAREVIADTLGPLAIEDDASRRLLATLRVFLQEGQSFTRAARRLGIHENTVAYRVRRVLDLTGHTDAGSLALRTAVELLPLLDREGLVDVTDERL